MLDYGSVVLTLSNVLLPSEKLYPNPTPSMIEGLPYDIEYDLRLIGCELIQTACLLLKLPQTAVATGQVLFHRYFYSSSFVRRQMEIVAMACTNLAAKIEENARRIRDVVNVFHHIKQVRSGKNIRPLLIDQTYIDRKNEVIKAERRLLKELGFCVYVKHPHKMITMYLKVLEKERERHLVQYAWNYMNDSLRTDIFLRFTPETIACACIDLAARTLQITLPKSPPWFIIFGARQSEIHFIMIAILRLYEHRPKSLDELEKLVNTIREKRDNDRKQIRSDLIQSTELGNDSPSQQIAQNSISSTVINTTTMTTTFIQQDASTVIATTQEITNVTTTTTNGKIIKKRDRGSSRESSTVNTHRHHRSRRKRSSTRSRSSSRSTSRSSVHRSQKKKKTSRRSRSRSRSSTPKRRKHQKEKRHRSRSSNRRKKDKKRRSRSSSPEESQYSTTNKHPLSTKDTNNNLHQRSHHHHHSSKHSNGVSSSSNKKLKN
ncbi:unnamed protein product [Adineta steineri]|uniref:Cyclin-like domain-containing protein n=1 Tax=Adineta steineri TaxID=433720 RepID=A0A815MPI1_9BILA|nr:unnamed protein product [Adineta steineri]CAF1621738.1 unnamed protein product [Adineta steineri]